MLFRSLLMPITLILEPTTAFITFGGIYYGAMFGGSTAAILLRMPGEGTSVITVLDGNAMARQGRGAAALATAAIGSFVAGVLGTLALAFSAGYLVQLALRFGPAEYFALMIVAFLSTSVLLGQSMVRGISALLFGVLLGLVGIDMQTGQARMTFGFTQLLDGVDLAVIAIGTIALGELIHAALHPEPMAQRTRTGSLWWPMNGEDFRRSWKPWLRGTAIGFPLGALPAGGGEIPTFLSYAAEKALSKRPEEFGNGAIEGVAGPEAANNASTAGVLLPLLSLGLPTSATAAIILVAFQSYGIQPGPFLLTEQSSLVWGMIASLLLGNLALLILNLPLAGLWAKILDIPHPPLYAGIAVISTISIFAMSQSEFDLVMLFGFGIIGYGMKRFGFPTSPLVVGLILGPLAEQQFRRAMTLSGGDPMTFLEHPISAGILIVAALLVIASVALKRNRKTAAALSSESGV